MRGRGDTASTDIRESAEGAQRTEQARLHAVMRSACGGHIGWGSWGFFSNKRQIFVRQISIHRGKFSRDFAKSGKPPPSPRAISLVRLRRGQAICRLAQLARFLIRNGAGRGERARISGRFAELTLRGCRLSPNRRSLLFGLACSVLCVALSLLSRNKRLHQSRGILRFGRVRLT